MAGTLGQRGRCSLLELLALAILISEGELHGYALCKRVMSLTRMRWRPSVGTVYRLLNDMASRGLVARSERGRRRSYSVTPKGVEYFIESAREPLTRKAGVLAAVLEAYFKLAEREPGAVPEDLRERLRALLNVLESNRGLIA